MNEQRVLIAGIDTLYLNAYYADPQTFGRMSQPLSDTTQQIFSLIQEEAKKSRCERETWWSLDGKPLYMLSHGSGKVWHWIIKNDDVNIQIGNGDYRGILAHVRIASQYLWGIGALHYVLDSIRKCLNNLFDHEMFLSPSEIDLCADLANWPTRELDPLHFVTKARKKKVKFADDSLIIGVDDIEYSGPKQDTFYLGKRSSAVHGKVYDKLKEIKDHRYEKQWYLDILKERCGWDGEEPVTRVEITTKREALKELGIETIEDLENKLKDLWGYLVGTDAKEGWSRYATPLVNELTGHVEVQRQRWPAHTVWNLVKHAFDSLSEEPAKDMIRIRKQRVNLDATTASIAGYLTSRTVYLCASKDEAIENMSLKGAVNDALSDIEVLLKKRGVSFQDLLRAKQHRYYLKKAATREADLQHDNRFFKDDQDAS